MTETNKMCDRQNEEEYLMLSGIQHYAFCPRQWALIHMENIWQDNVSTYSGQKLHQRVDDPDFQESRKDIFISRSVPVRSERLKLYGTADMVEYHKRPKGVSLKGKSGLWQPQPVEYKHGQEKFNDCDRIQLCAQGICLEEIFQIAVSIGHIFYGRTRRREVVEFSSSLREKTIEVSKAMHLCLHQGVLPVPKYRKACDSCSLCQHCMPKLGKRRSAKEYLNTFKE